MRDTGGDTLIDAIGMAVDAASGWSLDEIEEGEPIPPASKQEEEADEFAAKAREQFLAEKRRESEASSANESAGG